MPNARALRLDPPAPRPLAERGRMLFVDDVLALYGTKPNGTPRRTRLWVLRRFAREYRHRDGREVYWFANDVAKYFDAQKEGAA